MLLIQTALLHKQLGQLEVKKKFIWRTLEYIQQHDTAVIEGKKERGERASG